MNKLLPNSFQVPNTIVDDFIKSISGNELKIYLIIVRKTKGWNKKYDGISLSQFELFSGIARNTIRKSLKILIEFNFIKEKKRDGKYSYFYLADPYQKLTMSKNDTVYNLPLPKNDTDPCKKLTIQKDTKQNEEERIKYKLENFEAFYAWLPKNKIKTEKWHKQKIRNNLLDDDKKTLVNFKSFLDEQQNINSHRAMADIAKEQFELLKMLVTTKTANEINELDKNKGYKSLFKEATNNFIVQRKGLVELSSSIENKNYHAWLLEELQKEYLIQSRTGEKNHEC
jgi:predicted transcriptional regulator